MRGPLRSLGFARTFEEALGVEQNDPTAAATAFVDIAQQLTEAGFGGHGDALRRRAVQAYGAAGRDSDAIWLQLRIIADSALDGRWTEFQGHMQILRHLTSEFGATGSTIEPGLAATISILDVAETLFADPVLARETVSTAVETASPYLDTLLARLPSGEAKKGALLLAAGGATISIIEFAVAAEAFAAIMMADGGLRRFAGALSANVAQIGLHLSTRLCLAITEARDPFARDSSEWAQLQTPTALWELNDRDAALVLARYARARARGAAPADADAAWRRAAEFASRAQLFSDIAGWMSAQVRLRYRYGPIDWTELGNLRQMVRLLALQPSERLLPMGSAREEALDDLQRGAEGLRSAALAAQRLRVLAAAGGLWEEELAAHSLLGDIFERSGEPLLAVFHRIRAGEDISSKRTLPQQGQAFLDITAELNRPPAAERASAYSALSAQAELIPNDLVDQIAQRACHDIEDALNGKIAETPFSGIGVLRAAAQVASAIAGRASAGAARRIVHILDRRLDQDKGTIAWTDESHLQILVSVGAGDDDDNAAEAFRLLSRLLAIESPALRFAGRTLGAVVRRRPGKVRDVLIQLAAQGNEHSAEMLAGWSLTGPPGRDTIRDADEERAWRAAEPFATDAAERLAAPPKGMPGSASLLVGFPGDAGLVTILDRSDIDVALNGMLTAAADRLHLSATRQQALVAASILVAGDSGDRLGSARLSEVFDLACEYARGEHDGSAMDDLAGPAHPLSSFRINMGAATLAADGLCLAARARRDDSKLAELLSIVAQILQGRPDETVLNGVAHAIAAVPSLSGAPTSVSIRALASSPSESMRSVSALHWALTFGRPTPKSIQAALDLYLLMTHHQPSGEASPHSLL